MDRRRQKGRKLGSSRRLMMKQESGADAEAEAGPKSEEDSMFNEMAEKIQQLLSNDGTDTNVVTREDMEKISGVIYCTVQDLEELFDELNKDGRSYITYEEFTSGLKNLINSSGGQWNQTRKRKSIKRITEFPRSPSLEETDTEERKQFKSFMEQLGAHSVFEDESEIWKMWTRLGHEEPHLLENLEEFLAKVTNQIKEAKIEKETLETMLKKRITEHNIEVQHLYEEMEQQMREEITKLTNESNARSSIHNEAMKNSIEVKNTEVQQLISVQNELEKELYKLRSMEQVTKSENEKLKRTNQDLELDLEKIRDQLSEAQGCLSEMQEKMVQHEHEKEIKNNEELMNISSAQDTTQKEKNYEQESEQSDPQESIDLEKQNTFTNATEFKPSRSRVISIEEDPIQECLLKYSKAFGEGIAEEMPTKNLFSTTEAGDSVHIPHPGANSPAADGDSDNEHSSISFQINTAMYRDVKKIDIASEVKRTQQDFDFQSINTNQFSNLHEKLETETVSAEDKSKKLHHLEEFHADPDNVYKIMFVGNTHVGKTSFLQQIHEGSYHKSASATIGVDYRIKSLIVDNKQYALQLWDTAGQERFYSITEQFFRKADGMVIMYDVTSRETFSGVRRWLNCIREKVIDDIIILLLGNKIDCDAERQVTFHDGQKLAQEYKLLFAECSAASGINVTESLIQIIRSLKIHEDNMKTNVVTLKRSASPKKTKCCT